MMRNRRRAALPGLILAATLLLVVGPGPSAETTGATGAETRNAAGNGPTGIKGPPPPESKPGDRSEGNPGQTAPRTAPAMPTAHDIAAEIAHALAPALDDLSAKIAANATSLQGITALSRLSEDVTWIRRLGLPAILILGTLQLISGFILAYLLAFPRSQGKYLQGVFDEVRYLRADLHTMRSQHREAGLQETGDITRQIIEANQISSQLWCERLQVVITELQGLRTLLAQAERTLSKSERTVGTRADADRLATQQFEQVIAHLERLDKRLTRTEYALTGRKQQTSAPPIRQDRPLESRATANTFGTREWTAADSAPTDRWQQNGAEPSERQSYLTVQQAAQQAPQRTVRETARPGLDQSTLISQKLVEDFAQAVASNNLDVFVTDHVVYYAASPDKEHITLSDDKEAPLMCVEVAGQQALLCFPAFRLFKEFRDYLTPRGAQLIHSLLSPLYQVTPDPSISTITVGTPAVCRRRGSDLILAEQGILKVPTT